MSLFFKKNRLLYYEYLNNVRYDGDWESWFNFFLEGIIETSNDARETILKIQKLFAEDENKLQDLGRAQPSALEILQQFEQKPVLTVAEIEKKITLARPTIISSINRLIKLGIITNTSKKKWGQTYAYANYINLLSPESNPL